VIYRKGRTPSPAMSVGKKKRLTGFPVSRLS